MGMPAFLSPSASAPSSTDEPLPSLSVEAERACSSWWEAARAAWALHPEEGTAAEDEALHATFGLLLEVSRAFVDHPQAKLRAFVNEGMRRVMYEQRATAEDDRSFALRQLEAALEHWAVASETLAVHADLDEVFDEAVLGAEEVQGALPSEIRPLYRAHGALLMAFETMGAGPPTELRYWARQAVERWRGIVADLPALTAMVRGAHSHVRARHAWETWTDEDRAVERDAWKALR